MTRGVATLATSLGVTGVSLLAIWVTLSSIQKGDNYDAKLDAFPSTIQACNAAGGTWTHGPFGEPICQKATADAGKACRRASDCEAACLAADSTANAGAGVCSSWWYVYGCNTEIESYGRYSVCRD